LHDTSEAYICDIPRPFKKYLTGYADMEKKIMSVIYEHFNIPEPTAEEAQIIKEADDYILAVEAKYLMKNTEDWNLVDIGIGYSLQPHTFGTFMEFQMRVMSYREILLREPQPCN
jgi:hypothetical protein